MKKIAESIVNYVSLLESEEHMDVIINDKYNLLSDREILKDMPQLNKWHNNPFCLKIKQNLHSKCIFLRRKFENILTEANGGCYINLYCSAAEYAVPIIINGVHFCTVSVTGFKGKTTHNMLGCLAKRTDMSVEDFIELRNSNLTEITEKELQSIQIKIEMIAVLLKEYYCFSS